jgi:hypothetical protein
MRSSVLAARSFASEFCSATDYQATKQIGASSQGCFVYETPLIDSLPAIKEVERRQTQVSHARTQAACGTRHGERRLAPPSACGRARLPAFHLRFSPAGLSSRGLSSGPGFPKAARKLRRAARTVSGHSDAPRTPVVVPAGMMPEPPGCGPYLSARGRRTRSAVREYPPGRRPLKSEISRRYCHRRGEVKRVAFSLMNYGASRRAAFSERRSTPMILWWRPNNSSPRLRGEVGLRSNPGEGASPSCSG